MPMEYEDYLEHYGVKGMKWGQRRAQNRALNKASRKADRDAKAAADAEFTNARNKAVLAARGRADKNKLAVAKAKIDYKTNKATLGSREAKKILKQVKTKRYDDKVLASVAVDGREQTKKLVIDSMLWGSSYALMNAAAGDDIYRSYRDKYGS